MSLNLTVNSSGHGASQSQRIVGAQKCFGRWVALNGAVSGLRDPHNLWARHCCKTMNTKMATLKTQKVTSVDEDAEKMEPLGLWVGV